jgi:hypothetical protein
VSDTAKGTSRDAVGIGISMDASADTGLPDPATTTPGGGGGASLDVRSVESTGRATLAGRELLMLGPIAAF